MRFVHLADMHFDNSFSVLALKKDLGEKRRLEQRTIFSNAIEYIKKEKIKYLFISGDLYEHKYVKKSTIEYINSLFNSIPDTKVFISPGNHDPFLKNSFYATFEWSKNVIIFNSEIKMYEFQDVDVYGYGFSDFYCNSSGIENIKIKNKNKLNILVVHGSLNASDTLNLNYNPIKENDLKNIGFDYVALGHIHKANYTDKSRFVYPGSLISFGFDETGEHGMLDVSLDKDNFSTNFIKLDNRIFEVFNMDISSFNSQEDIIEKINNNFNEPNKMYEIILIGKRNFEIDLNYILKLITADNVLKIKDLSSIALDIEDIAKQKNLKGIFVNKCLEKLNVGNYSQEEINKIIEIGLGVL